MSHIFEKMLADADIAPHKMPPQILYHQRSGSSEHYGFYYNLSTETNTVDNVNGFDLVSQKEIDGTLVLDGYGVAVVKY